MANYFELNHLPQGQVEYDERLQFVPVSETTSYKGASIGDVSQKGLDNSTTPVAYEEVAPEWPQGPQKIAPKGYIWWIGTIGDFILSLTPVAFFVIAALAIQLEGQPTEHNEHGESLVEATKLAPTIYPIVFAAVASRFYKILALWSATRSRGITIGALEQILGSQSFAGSLFRLFSVRSHISLGIMILLTWALSPLGGQSSSRLIFKTIQVSDSKALVYYSTTDSESSFSSASGLQVASTAANSLFTSSLMAAEEQRRSMTDLWTRPRIPRLRDLSNNDWQIVDQAAMTEMDYASLIGIKILGLGNFNSTTSYNLTAEATYNDLDCKQVQTGASVNETLAYIPEDRWTTPIYYVDKMNDTTGKLLPGYTDPRSPDNKRASFFVTSDFSTPERESGGHLHIMFGSHEGDLNYTLYNCTLRNVPLELDILCSSPLGCGAQRIRRSKSPQWDKGDAHSPFTLEIPVVYNFLSNFPFAAGFFDNGSPRYQSTIDNYLRGITQFPFKLNFLSPWPTNVTDEAFSRRLTLLFNTYYYASLDPFTATDSNYSKFPGNTDRIMSQPVYSGPYLSNNYEGATIVMVNNATEYTHREIYGLNRHWATILVLCTSILQILSLAGLFLRLTTPAPDIFDYGASLTRENPFVPVPKGGSAIGGPERARMLRKMRVKMADVRPDDQVGYVALVATTGVVDQGVNANGEVIPTRALSRWRRYW
ncbi:hypothetical protein B0H65DRAFT_429262 [Neurospora tetraspora]|uniref:Uncharacterized protein n=1 Tax=Neurospora tetraspora TaxID=94610 RepID=A0AAE0JCM6_9PEZI|nr:hypothetical protein B0H65DRAFT_429262 [Neurospora tetraspora]